MTNERIRLTIVVPTLNEANELGATLDAVWDHARGGVRPHVHVVDGGSTDGTKRIARRHGAKFHVVRGGRGAQCAHGASLANSDGNLLFLHADTTLPMGYDTAINSALTSPQVACGAFSLGLRTSERNFALRFVAWGANVRSRVAGLPYGDQGLFVRHSTLRTAGGYPRQPFLDDYELVRRLKAHARTRKRDGTVGETGSGVIILKDAVLTSARRWHRFGVLRTTMMNQLVLVGYHLGVPVSRLKDWYLKAATWP